VQAVINFGIHGDSKFLRHFCSPIRIVIRLRWQVSKHDRLFTSQNLDFGKQKAAVAWAERLSRRVGRSARGLWGDS
jgi:hypothetical protein